MKNKIKTCLFALIIIGVITLGLTYNNKNEVITKTKKKKQSNIAIMIKEDGANDYAMSSSKDIPKGDYVLNYEKSYCKNNGKIGNYDNTLGKVSFSFIGTDSCYLYFDYKEDTSLYGTIKKRAQTDTTYLALYTGEGADTYANPVYYYKGNVQNNNVLFAGFCWKIVRTTETGGVKIVYNGEQKDISDNYKLLDESEYTNLTNDANYPYTFDSTNKTWTSTNTGTNSSTIAFTAPSNGNYILNYDLSMYNSTNYVYVEIFKDDVSQGKFTGTTTGQIIFSDLHTTNTIKVVFTRKYSFTSGSRNNIIFSFGKANSIIKTCNNTGTDSQLESTKQFNEKENSPAYVGYMYNTVYPYSSKVIINSANFSGTKAYGDGATYASNKYTLTNATTLSVSSSNISTLVGKYTCNSSSTTGTCSNLWYIVGYRGTTIYYYSLSGGTTDGTTLANKNYVFGKSFTYSKGAYTLSDTVTLNSDTFITNKSNVDTHHYTCLSSGTTCSSIYYVYYINIGTPYYITLTGGKSVNDALNEMLYADDVNKNDSTIKAYIDSWYESKIKGKYEDKLEDTVFCNDRSMSNESSNGWNPNGGDTTQYLLFKNYSTSNQSLVCANETDRFSHSNTKAYLKYPIGLLSVPELSLAGYGISHYFNNRQWVWLTSPANFDYRYAIVGMTSYDDLSILGVYDSKGVRPSVSIQPGTEYTSGDGSYTSPFVIE